MWEENISQGVALWVLLWHQLFEWQELYTEQQQRKHHSARIQESVSGYGSHPERTQGKPHHQFSRGLSGDALDRTDRQIEGGFIK